MIRCDCVNLKHDPRCTKTAKMRCEACGVMLCGTCANQHHAHSNIKRLTP